MHTEKTESLKASFLDLEKNAKVVNERLRVFLMGLDPAEMLNRIRQLNLSDKSLNFLCEGIALETEDYEICIAVEKLKKERAAHKANDNVEIDAQIPPAKA